MIYPFDYGYLADSESIDANGIDLWRGSKPEGHLDGIICTVDVLKEVKLLLGCTQEEQAQILAFHNVSDYMK